MMGLLPSFSLHSMPNTLYGVDRHRTAHALSTKKCPRAELGVDAKSTLLEVGDSLIAEFKPSASRGDV
jgi:hypothetical protein